MLSTPQSVNLAEKEKGEALDSQAPMQRQAASGRSNMLRATALPWARHEGSDSHVGGVGLQAANDEGDGGGEPVRHLGWHGAG